MPQDSTTTRRAVLAGGTATLFGLAGCLGSNEVEKEEPNQDGTGTLGELRWILEEQHELAVTSMTFSDGTVHLTYGSTATNREESRSEIGEVISAYGLVVESDAPSERLAATISDRFEEQSTGYHVEAEWVDRWRSGEMSAAMVAQRVFNTRQFPESASQ